MNPIPYPDEHTPQCAPLGGFSDHAYLYKGRLVISEGPGVDDGAFVPAASATVFQRGMRGTDGPLDRLADLLHRCGFGTAAAVNNDDGSRDVAG